MKSYADSHAGAGAPAYDVADRWLEQFRQITGILGRVHDEPTGCKYRGVPHGHGEVRP